MERFKPKERKPFNQVEEAEQIERFKKLKELFSYSSPFRDFWENVYKYLDRFQPEGRSLQDVTRRFNELTNIVRFLDEALKCFREIKLKETGKPNYADLHLLYLRESPYRIGFIENGKLNVEKLIQKFRFSLLIFIHGGEKIGRTPNIREEEIEGFVSDMEYILKKINDYLPPGA